MLKYNFDQFVLYKILCKYQCTVYTLHAKSYRNLIKRQNFYLIDFTLGMNKPQTDDSKLFYL